MINRISKALLFNPSFSASFQNKIIKPKPILMKPPPLKPKIGQIPIALVAQQFKINEQALRKQLSDPKMNFINEQEYRALQIINNINFSQRNHEKQVSMIKKSPVITIMGHVDHGKTTLIDYLRQSKIAEGQIGGITQKIGAFHIDCHGQKITFIDTPGHEAFSNMRQRGAKITDLIVLVVASTEGVKKQTQQVIDIIKRDQIPTIVAISKIDLPTADVQSVQTSLFQAGLNIEPKGGNIPVVHISAKSGKNIDFLTELILQETKQLKAIQEGLSQGFVLEGYQNSKGFNAMTLIINKGILKTGSILIVGDQYTKIRNLYDDKGRQVQKARPGDAVQIIGIPNIPLAGDFIFEIATEKEAKFISSKRKQKMAQELQNENDRTSVKTSKLKLDYRTRRKMYNSATNDAWLQQFKLRQEQLSLKIDQLKLLAQTDPKFNEVLLVKEKQLEEHKKYVYEFLVNIGINKNCFNVIMKFSDRNIQETILQQLQPIIEKLLANNNITVNILRSNIGEVVINDIQDASISNAQIFTFGVQTSSEAIQTQKRFAVNPKCHKLIHNFIKDFEQTAITCKKKMSFKGTEKGRALIAQVYSIKGKKGEESIKVPGIKVTSGKIEKKYKLYILRNDSPITDALFIKAIKVFKKEMQQVKKGDECTITLSNTQSYNFEKGDQIVAYDQS